MNQSFRDMLQQLVNLSQEEKITCGVKAYQTLLPALRRYDKDTEGLVLTIAIMGTAAASDGKLVAQEMAFIMALAKARGVELTVEQAADMVKSSADKDGFEMIRNLAGALDGEERSALIVFVATICALDDSITAKEIDYLESLL